MIASGSDVGSPAPRTIQMFAMMLAAMIAWTTSCGPTPHGSRVAVPMPSTIRSTGVVPLSLVMMPEIAVVTANTVTASMVARMAVRLVTGPRSTRNVAIATATWNAFTA